VIAQHVSLPDPDSAFATYLPLDDLLMVRDSFAVEQGFSIEQIACHFPVADSGREVRALIESFLL
jgi:hypothetical protein